MFRKAIVVAGAAALVLASMTAVPAGAATKVSNGVACKKVGQTTKVNGSSYRCAKNPLVKNSKLTWLSLDCLSSVTNYNSAVKARTDLGDVAMATAELDNEIAVATEELSKATAALDSAKAQITKSRGILNVTTNASDKLNLSTAISALADAIIKLTNRRMGLDSKVRELNAKKALLISAPAQIAANVKDARAYANLVCMKGF
jgi:hypothetical protein